MTRKLDLMKSKLPEVMCKVREVTRKQAVKRIATVVKRKSEVKKSKLLEVMCKVREVTRNIEVKYYYSKESSSLVNSLN
ncbi:hypothetical protein FLK61_34840 [Paenalkalicoccus suaedae]|uniref:Uncharacterized protein n=1 Tax=Paenalkalicoccus suaedae TaxID=2592382 RepID=A0A859FGA0_9BACI|nr:hypothetical protein FLK61_34840 [Paenalkalicoccus suaedae]